MDERRRGGAWLRARLDDPWRGTIHDLVPRRYAAYVRVLHPATRDRPVGRAWPPPDAPRTAWEAFARETPEVDVERVAWAHAAAALGGAVGPLASWSDVVGPDAPDDGPRDRDGWRYQRPDPGDLEPATLAAVAQRLAAHTGTPDAGHVAVWDGWGGLLGHHGPTPSRSFFGAAAGGEDGRHHRMVAAALPDRFRNPFARERWQPGILSDEVSTGPRLELPRRSHVLFSGGVVELTSPDWVLRAPWRDLEAEEHGFPPSAQSPSLVWPADRAWVLVTDVDLDSTLVAGSVDVVAAVVDDPAVEAFALLPDAAIPG